MKTNSNKIDYIVHLIYASCFLLTILIVIGYMAWDKNQTAIQLKIAKEEKATQAKQHKEQILKCIVQAENQYAADWAKACRTKANKNTQALQNCINEAASFVKYIKTPYTTESQNRDLYNFKVTQCKSIYGSTNYNPDCALPAVTAKNLNEGLEKFEKLCHEMVVP